MSQVKVYDHAGNEFLAKDEESAQKAVESGQYFFDRPEESLADELGLQLVPGKNQPTDRGDSAQMDGANRYFVYDKDGNRHSMWAIDAKECVEMGEYYWSPPAEYAPKAEKAVAPKAKAGKAPKDDAKKAEVPPAKPGRGRTK